MKYSKSENTTEVIGTVPLDKQPAAMIPRIVDLNSLKELLPGICDDLFQQLGSQQLEATYQRGLMFDLEEAGVHVIYEPEIKLTYKGKVVGTRRVDLLLVLSSGEKAIIELKAVNEMALSHGKQLEYYLHHADVDLGYLINFPHDNMFPSVDDYSSFRVRRLRGLVERLQHLLTGGVALRPRNCPKRRQVEVLEITRRILTDKEREKAKQKTPEKTRYGRTKRGTECKNCIRKGGFCPLHLDQRL